MRRKKKRGGIPDITKYISDFVSKIQAKYKEYKQSQQPPAGMGKEERKRFLKAAAARRKKRNIRLAVYAAAAIIVILIIIIIVSCSSKKKDSAEEEETAAVSMGEVVYSHDDIKISDDIPTQGTDGTTYRIHINKALNVLIIYEGETPIKAIRCSTGADTPEGTLSLTSDWFTDWLQFDDQAYSQYAYRLSERVYFIRSVPYTSENKGTLKTDIYNQLGSSVTQGSIYVPVADAIYIGETCGEGTVVEIVNDASESIPIEVSEPYKIPATFTDLSGWDPTDPASANPWHNYTFTLEIPDMVDIAIGSSETVLNAILSTSITAIDTYGNDVSSYVSFDGTYDLETKGKYPLTVTVQVGPAKGVKTIVLDVSKNGATIAETESETEQ